MKRMKENIFRKALVLTMVILFIGVNTLNVSAVNKTEKKNSSNSSTELLNAKSNSPIPFGGTCDGDAVLEAHVYWQNSNSYGQIDDFSVPSIFLKIKNPFKMYAQCTEIYVDTDPWTMLSGYFQITVSDTQGHTIWGDTHNFCVYFNSTGQNQLFYWSGHTTGNWNLRFGKDYVNVDLYIAWMRYNWVTTPYPHWQQADPGVGSIQCYQQKKITVL